MTRIPLDPDGYKVDPLTGTIHTRYAIHADGHRTRTEKGALTILAGKKGKACPECYGQVPPYADKTPRPAQKRRVPTETTDGPASLPGD